MRSFSRQGEKLHGKNGLSDGIFFFGLNAPSLTLDSARQWPLILYIIYSQMQVNSMRIWLMMLSYWSAAEFSIVAMNKESN